MQRIILLILMLCPSLCVRAQSPDNMIQDGGFELPKGQSSWYENNWDGCAISVTRDHAIVHTGQASLHVRMPEKTCAHFQLVQSNIEIRKGDRLGLRFAVKGTEDPNAAAPVRVWLFHRREPYRYYFDRTIQPQPDWQVHDLKFTLGDDVYDKDNGLAFVIQEAGEFRLDDVCLYRLPARQAGEPISGNQIANGSFEVGRDRWYATFREYGGYRYTPAATEANINADLFVEPCPDAPEGRYALRMPVFEHCQVTLTSAYFPLRYGHPATISFHMKASQSGVPFEVSLGHGQFPNHHLQTQRFVTKNHWQHYTMTLEPSPSTADTYFVQVHCYKPAEYLLDAVTVGEGESPPAYRPMDAPLVGWQPVDETHPGNIFPQGDPPRVSLLGRGKPGDKGIALHGRVVDTWDRPIADIETSISVDAQGYGRRVLELPHDRLGSFKCVLFHNHDSGETPAVEIVYHVPPKLRPLKESSDSFFGGHADMTPYNLRIAELVGMRRLRLHPPINTKWVVVEPEPGTFVFHTTGIERACEQGFQIVGTLGTTPTFYSSAPEGKATGNVFSNYAPADWEAWERYVARTIEAYRPWIDTWEHWNEPDGGFLKVRPDQDRVALYMEMLKRTAAVVERNNYDIRLIGGAIVTPRRPFAEAVLHAGGSAYFDVFSFHHYGRTPEAQMVKLLNGLRGYPARRGGPATLWHSEGGRWLNYSPSWLSTAGLDQSGPDSLADGAASLTCTMAMLKAMGVGKHFHYPSNAHPAGHIIYRHGHNLTDINGIPHPLFGAHAAAVWLLEEAEGIGFEYRQANDAEVGLAEFRRDGRPLWVFWSDRETDLEAVSQVVKLSEGQAFDMMGNKIELPEKLGRFPIYWWARPAENPD